MSTLMRAVINRAPDAPFGFIFRAWQRFHPRPIKMAGYPQLAALVCCLFAEFAMATYRSAFLKALPCVAL
jgi:hypothetical protein